MQLAGTLTGAAFAKSWHLHQRIVSRGCARNPSKSAERRRICRQLVCICTRAFVVLVSRKSDDWNSRTALAKTEVVLFTSTAFHADVENVDTGHVANHRIIAPTWRLTWANDGDFFQMRHIDKLTRKAMHTGTISDRKNTKVPVNTCRRHDLEH